MNQQESTFLRHALHEEHSQQFIFNPKNACYLLSRGGDASVSLRPGDIDGMRKALERIRVSPLSPSGVRALPFAKVVGAVFEEIESLRSERFTLIDICRALEAEGYLPVGSNPRSLSVAMCRERKRRASRQADQTGATSAKARKVDAAPSEKSQGVTKEVPAAGVSPGYQAGAASKFQLKPGNLFVIEPLDLTGLPEL
jgi:hypothetical protein